ncbi:MAG: hypothetical protein AAF670_10815 [Planctomycetota bacterium]
MTRPSDRSRSGDSPSRLRLNVRDDSSAADGELDRLSGIAAPKTVRVPLAQMTRLLIDATESNRTWLQDFADDVVQIDSDLFEVLMAYQSMQRSAA